MKTTDENIKVLSTAVFEDAREDAEKARADAKAKVEEIQKSAREEADAARKKILDQATAQADRIRSQAVATTQLKARTMQLEQREKLLEDVFQAAREKIASVQKGSGYEKSLELLLREAVSQLGAESARVRADKATQKLLTSGMLDKVSKDLKVQLQAGDALDKGTGVVVETDDGRRQYDNTLETRLKRMQDSLRSQVYHILMGEAI